MPLMTETYGWPQVLADAPASGKVLVVEDEDPVREGLEKLLVRYGHTVRTAASAEEADAWLDDAGISFDVILLDIELPRMKGVEFLQWIMDRSPEVAVIMLTGLDDPKVAVRCLEEGARTYLVKPVDPDFLRLALRDALALRRLLRERNEARGRA